MALKMFLRISTFAVFALILASAFSIISAKAEEQEQEVPGINLPVHDPAQIVSKALLCFNDKYIYKSCEESYRLSASGSLDVPPEQTDAYCGGPCQTETHLVLTCIDNIFTDFVFYNRATIQDIRDTIHGGCGYGPERGNFDVLEHIEAEESDALPLVFRVCFLILLMVLGHGLLFM